MGSDYEGAFDLRTRIHSLAFQPTKPDSNHFCCQDFHCELMNYAQARSPVPELESELRKVALEPKSELRARYISLFQYDPPRAFGPDLLRRSVAQRMQENAHGGLSKASQRELNRLVSALIAKPDVDLTVARRAQSGTVLVRDWNGKSHRVVITADGFYYDDWTFSNLSEIARLITGTRWNGPRFFGLRRQKRDECAASKLAGQVKSAATGRPKTSNSTSPPKRVRAGHGL
jgi:Protein of unknown function (DUF2924)